MIDTVTFDLWNTLLSNAPPDNQKYSLQRVEKLSSILRENEREVKPDILIYAYHRAFEKCIEIWEKNLDISTEEQIEIMFGFLGGDKFKNTPPDLMSRLVEVFVSPILDDPPSLIEGTKEALKAAQKKSCKIGLICNTGRTPGKTIRILLERLGIARYFSVTTFSDELKIRKPDPGIFLHTLAQLKSRPESSLHLGDLIDADILGAKNAGMISVHFNPKQIPYEKVHPDLGENRVLRVQKGL
jgi:putative hydrolase of the HAD superfamily